MLRQRIEGAQIAGYRLALIEPYRPPSRGGNTSALHRHYLNIGGETYSFCARGSQQWVFKSDHVWFDYQVNEGYRNVLKQTFRTTDSSGHLVIRGNRGYKLTLRSTPSRLPASRREARD